jgi:DNA-binding MarR family transcriptional regulator
MARQKQFRESSHEAFLLLHNVQGLLTKLEETTYAAQAGISYQQYLILITVESSEPPVNQTTVAKAIQRNLNSISMIIDRMEKLGLVIRERSKDDRRETHLKLTALGRKKLAKAIEVGGALGERLGSALTEEDLQEGMRLMAKFRNQVLNEMGREPITLASERPVRKRVLDVLRRGLTSSR